MKTISFLIIIINAVLIFFTLSCSDLVQEKKDDETVIINLTQVKRIYWSTHDGANASRIKSADIDNTSDTVIIFDCTNDINKVPVYIAIDSIRDKIFWISMDRKIYRANLNGSNIEKIYESGMSINDICVDPIGGKIYWSQSSLNKIVRANPDGTATDDIITISGELISRIKIEYLDRKIFFKGSKIFKANLDGSSIETALNNAVQRDFGLDMKNKKIYYVPDLATTGFDEVNYDGTGFKYINSVKLQIRIL